MYPRQHLSGVLVTFRQQLAAEFASRNCSYTAAVPAKEFYIVPRTGVFTTDTRLNTGLRLQRRPELDGDLERELHQNRVQLDAHPVSSVAVLRLRQQVVVVCVCVCVCVRVCVWSYVVWCLPMRCRPQAFRVCGVLLRCRSLAFRALAQSRDLLGVLRTKWISVLQQ